MKMFSQTTIFPSQKSTIADLKLSVSDLPMLSCHYIQKECLFTKHPSHLIHLLKQSLSEALTQLPPLAGRLTTDHDGYVFTRARKLHASKTTTFRMAVNCRHRLEPKLDPLYFGSAIQSIPTYAAAGEVLGNDIRWCAKQLNKNVTAHDDSTVRKYVENWERDPRCFPLGNFDGAMITMGSSPRFPMYENDFGWGRPIAVRSGRANKFDGKISAFPGREGGGTVELEVVLAPETMAGLESDPEFMQYVSGF